MSALWEKRGGRLLCVWAAAILVFTVIGLFLPWPFGAAYGIVAALTADSLAAWIAAGEP